MANNSNRKLGKTCTECGISITDKNKSGYCNIHRDRTGVNNPFYGKTHSQETVDRIKEATSKNSKELWKNEEYRQKVIAGVSKPRREGFKEEQSARVTQWYKDNPEQKTLRSITMKKSWNDGKIEPNSNSINSSKLEKALFKDVKGIALDVEQLKTIKDSSGRWMFPDILVEGRVIIEFYGDYWHANPRKYKEKDIVHHNITAKEIWDRDKERINRLNNMGYCVEVVWEDEYKNDKEAVLDKLDSLLNWEYCY